MRPSVRDPAIVGLVVFLVYLATLHPDVAGGDSGELAAAIATGGVIHPPGYPLYALLGKVALLVPHGTIAWRLNLLSAACDAGAAAVLDATLVRATRSRAAGLLAAALFASAPGIWRYAVCAEVFALDNLLVAVMLLLAVLYAQERRRRWAYAAAFVFGLGMSDHHTFVCTGLPLAAWGAWLGRRDLLRRRVLAGLLVGFVGGLLPYLSLPLADSRHAVVSWGETDTWHGFWTHVLRREYGTFRLAVAGIAAPGRWTATLGAWADDLVHAIGPWSLPLAAIGVVACARSARGSSRLGAVALVPPVLAVGVVVVLGNLPVTDSLHRAIVARFWQQPELYACAACGVGVAVLERRLPRWLVEGPAVALALLSPALRFHAMDHRGDRLVARYGEEILRAAPPGALVLTRGDLITNAARYAQLEGARPDLRLVDLELLGYPWEVARVRARYPDVVLPGARYMPWAADGFAMKALLDANAGGAPILLCGGVKSGDTSGDATYGFWPFGLCTLVHSGHEPMNVDAWIADSEAALPRIDFGAIARPEGSWEAVVWSDFWEARDARAAQLIAIAGADPSRRGYLDVAAQILEALVATRPDVPAHVWRNLATALGRGGLETPARRARAAEAWRQWLARAPADDPARAAIEEEAARLAAPE